MPKRAIATGTAVLSTAPPSCDALWLPVAIVWACEAAITFSEPTVAEKPAMETPRNIICPWMPVLRAVWPAACPSNALLAAWLPWLMTVTRRFSTKLSCLPWPGVPCSISTATFVTLTPSRVATADCVLSFTCSAS